MPLSRSQPPGHPSSVGLQTHCGQKRQDMCSEAHLSLTYPLFGADHVIHKVLGMLFPGVDRRVEESFGETERAQLPGNTRGTGGASAVPSASAWLHPDSRMIVDGW
jgi:hypothetical protein